MLDDILAPATSLQPTATGESKATNGNWVGTPAEAFFFPSLLDLQPLTRSMSVAHGRNNCSRMEQLRPCPPDCTWRVNHVLSTAYLEIMDWPDPCIYIWHEDAVTDLESASRIWRPLDRCSLIDPLRNELRSCGGQAERQCQLAYQCDCRPYTAGSGDDAQQSDNS